MLNALNDTKHPEHKEFLNWAGDYFHYKKFNIEDINDFHLERRKTLST
jgi:hypothetical protein